MVLLKIGILLVIFAGCSSEDFDFCSIENDEFWYKKEYIRHEQASERSVVSYKKGLQRLKRAPRSELSMSSTRDPKRITYWLYTRSNPDIPQKLEINNTDSVINSNFDFKNVTVFLIHGWLGSRTNAMCKLLTEGKVFTANVVVVDWSYLASFNYLTASLSVPGVGEDVGKFINWLVGLGMSFEEVHVVGFSLGAHVAGNAGKCTGSRIRRITALDPASIMWPVNPERLVKTDAQYVEVIHTNTMMFGYKEPCGHADFYPNGGGLMPECWINMCSHSMAYQYMADSVRYNNLVATSCNHVANVLDGDCSGYSYPMGNGDLTKNGSGLFRVDTISGRRSMLGASSANEGKMCY